MLRKSLQSNVLVKAVGQFNEQALKRRNFIAALIEE